MLQLQSGLTVDRSDYLSSSEVAKKLGVKPAAVRTKRWKRGWGQWVRDVNGHWYMRLSDFEAVCK